MAARIGKLPSRPVESNPRTTPYDMIDVSVGMTRTQARPFAITTDDKSGKQYPSKAVTSCPHCGHGIEFDVRLDLLLSGAQLTVGCSNCNAGCVAPLVPLEDPFRNPLVDGLVARADLNQLYSDPAVLKTKPRTAAERVALRRKKQMKDDVAPLEVEVADLAVEPMLPAGPVDAALTEILEATGDHQLELGEEPVDE